MLNKAVIPAQAGIQQVKNAFVFKPTGFPPARE